jgi:hypothetical protein
VVGVDQRLQDRLDRLDLSLPGEVMAREVIARHARYSAMSRRTSSRRRRAPSPSRLTKRRPVPPLGVW